ncbi:MAG: long-chain fatty acid--CoA ligase [Burkholderiaceae bacterium]
MSEPLHYRFWPKNLPHELELPQTSLYYNLEVSANRYPTKTATVFYDAILDYRTLRLQVDALAGWLQQRCGVSRGDRVMLFMQNSPQFIIGYYAILRANGFVVPVNPMLKTEELRHYAFDSGAKAVLCAQDVFAQIEPLLAAKGGAPGLQHALVTAYSEYLPEETELSVPEFVRAPVAPLGCAEATPWGEALAEECVPGPLLVGPDDWCVMPYTSGTTGKPKGCIHTHRTVMHTAVAQAVLGSGLPNSVMLGVVPLFHVTGMQACMNMILYLGASVVLLPRWDRAVAAAMIERYRITAWTNVPTMVVDLLAMPDLDRYDLSSMQRVSGGGAAMPEAVAQKMREIWGLDFIEGYGLSETIAPTHSNPFDRPKKQCLGIPIFDTESKIINPDTLEEMPQGETGEVISRGPQIFLGYWNDPEKTSAAFIELEGKRWFRTGDLARIDEDGYFFLVDRLKRMINASGFKVWPAEVESMLYQHPAIQEACVIASQDAYRGETVKAVIVLRPQFKDKVTGEDIMSWAREKMAAYKVPRFVEFIEALPKSGTGKIMWRQLQEQEAARSASRQSA